MAAEAALIDRSIRRRDESPTSDGMPARSPNEADKGFDPKEVHIGLKTPADSSLSPLRRKRLQDLKAEVPLTPIEAEAAPPKKAKTAVFPAGVDSLVPVPESENSTLDPESAQNNVQVYIDQAVKPAAEFAVEQVRKERLVEIDTTLRVQSPPLPDTKLQLPWTVYDLISTDFESRLDAQRALLKFIKRELIHDESRWSGVSKLDKILSWSPFPARLGKVNIKEDIDDNSSATRYMAELQVGEDIDIQSLVSKAEGLRLLHPSDSDDEELEPSEYDDEEEELQEAKSDFAMDRSVPFPQENGTLTRRHVSPPIKLNPPASDEAGALRPQVNPVQQPVQAPSAGMDLHTLLLKRKMQLDMEKGNSAANGDVEPAALAAESDGKRPRLGPGKFQPFIALGLFSDRPLAGFMHRQGASLDETLKQGLQAAPAVQPVAPTLPVPKSTPVNGPLAQPQAPFHTPAILDPNAAMQVVISAGLLSNRTLVRRLQSLLPNMDLVERDLLPSRSNQGESKSRVADDADITLSPTTGLVTTTIQKLKQKPLPGQRDFFGIRDRIALVAQRCERLVVIVSEGRQPDQDGVVTAGPLDGRDCDALVDLTACTAHLDTDVEIRYIPGGEDDLTKWIASAISQHAVPNQKDIKLLQDETLWERFLRTAGMNAYAAQAILAKVKKSDNVLQNHDSSSSAGVQSSSNAQSFGLAAFVRITHEERIQHFGPMLGGDRVLARVGRVVDGPWRANASM
jgi:hypothetical protein